MIAVKKKIDSRPIEVEKVSLKELIREWAHDYFAGFFQLKGDNPLVKAGVWPWLQKVASLKGKAILVKKLGKDSTYKEKVPNNFGVDPEGVFMVGVIDEVKYKPNALRTPESIKVTYLDQQGEEIFNEDLLKPKFKNEAFLVMGNTFDWKPNLLKSEIILTLINFIYRSIVWDLEIYRPRLIIKTKLSVDKNIRRLIRADLEKYNFICFASADDGRTWELEKWTPESRFDKLQAMFRMNFNLFKELNNIRFNTSQKLEGRLPVKEVELNEDQFEGSEMVKQQEREVFIRWCYKVFEGWDYQLWSEGKCIFRIGDRYLEEEKERKELGEGKDKTEEKQEKLVETDPKKQKAKELKEKKEPKRRKKVIIDKGNKENKGEEKTD